MALDPEISLHVGQGVTPADPYGTLEKAANIATLMQNLSLKPQLVQQEIAASQASTTGQTLLNQQTARENATRQRLAELSSQNATVDPTTGNITIDNNAVANQAAKEGMDPGTVFGYLQKGAEAAQANIKTASDQNVYAHTVLDTANNLIRAQSDGTQAMAIASGAHQILSGVIGPAQAAKYATQYWQTPAQPIDPATGAPVPQGTPPSPDVVKYAGQNLIKQANVNALATITPEQAIQNHQTDQNIAIAQENVNQAGASGNVSPAARDPKSAISAQAQTDYMTAMGINPNTPEGAKIQGLSAAVLSHLPGPAAVVPANVVPGSVKGAAAGNAVTLNNQAQILDALAAAAKRVSPLGAGTTVQNIFQGAFDQHLMADPNFNEYVTRLKQAQIAGIPLDQMMGPASVSQYATSQANTYRQQAGTQTKLTTQPTFTTDKKGTIVKSSGDVASPKSKADYDALPNGTKYIGGDGVTRIKGQ